MTPAFPIFFLLLYSQSLSFQETHLSAVFQVQKGDRREDLAACSPFPPTACKEGESCIFSPWRSLLRLRLLLLKRDFVSLFLSAQSCCTVEGFKSTGEEPWSITCGVRESCSLLSGSQRLGHQEGHARGTSSHSPLTDFLQSLRGGRCSPASRNKHVFCGLTSSVFLLQVKTQTWQPQHWWGGHGHCYVFLCILLVPPHRVECSCGASWGWLSFDPKFPGRNSGFTPEFSV